MTRNVAIIVLDSVRKDFFDRFAPRIRSQAGISIDKAYAPSSWSTPSHASMFSGELPSLHGIHTYQRSFINSPADRFFHTTLSHETVGVSANVFAGGAYGFDSLFDKFQDVSSAWRYPRGLDPERFDLGSGSVEEYLKFALSAVKEPHRLDTLRNAVATLLHTQWKRIPGPKLVDDSGKAVCRISEHSLRDTTEPWFLFINIMEAHIPLQPHYFLDNSIHCANKSWCSDQYGVWELMRDSHPDYWNVRESLYQAYVEYLDRIVMDFIKQITQLSSYPVTAIVTADHGENHGEESAKGMANHKSSLSDQVLHVPLEIVNPPKPATNVSSRFTLLDLPDMVTALLNGGWEAPVRDVVPAELIGRSAGPYPENLDQEYYERTIRAAYKHRTKIIWDSLGNCERYEIDSSVPSEQKLSAERIRVPNWAKEQFPNGINEAHSIARSGHDDGQKISRSAETRLNRLGYK